MEGGIKPYGLPSLIQCQVKLVKVKLVKEFRLLKITNG